MIGNKNQSNHYTCKLGVIRSRYEMVMESVGLTTSIALKCSYFN